MGRKGTKFGGMTPTTSGTPSPSIYWINERMLRQPQNSCGTLRRCSSTDTSAVIGREIWRKKKAQRGQNQSLGGRCLRSPRATRVDCLVKAGRGYFHERRNRKQ